MKYKDFFYYSRSKASPNQWGPQLLMLFLLCFSLSPALMGQDRYVSTTGADATDCSMPGSPCLTINYAISQAVDGDEIDVAAGTYNEIVLIDKEISLLGPNAGVSAVTGTRVPEARLLQRININETQNVTVSGFEFFEVMTPTTWTIYIQGTSDNFTFRNNRFIDCEKDAIRSGISSNTANVTVTGNYIDNITNSVASGILLGGINGTSLIADNKIDLKNNGYSGIQTPSATGLTISGNEISNTTNQGLQLAGDCGDVVIENNAITNTNTSEGGDKGAVRLYGTTFTGPIDIRNNVLANSYNGVAIKDGQDISGKNITVEDNSLVGNTNASVYNGASTGTLDATCNWHGSDDLATVTAGIVGAVDFEPYIISGGDSGSAAPGFSPTGACTACSITAPTADKLTATYCVPEASNPPKQIRVDEPAADEEVVWILTGAPTGSTLTVGDEFGPGTTNGTVNSEFRVTGGFNGSRLTMRQDANNGTIYGTWTFDAKLVSTAITGCESTVTTGFTVTANEAPAISINSFAGNPFNEVCVDEQAVFLASASSSGPPAVDNYSWSFSGSPTEEPGAGGGGTGQLASDNTPRRIGATWTGGAAEMVDLTVTYDNGCSVTAPTHNVTVNETAPPTAEKLTAEYCVPESSNPPKQIRVVEPAADEQVIWVLTGAPTGSTLTVGDEFGVGTVNSEFRVTGGMNGSRLTMRQDANNGTIYGTWTFEAKLVNTTTGCESDVTTGFTVTANEPPSDAFRSAGTSVSFPFSANLDYDADHTICPGDEATYGTQANTASINTVSWNISGGGMILDGANARNVKVRWDNPGTHTLTFMVTNVATGCMSANSLQVTVLDAPAISIDDYLTNPYDQVCVGDEARYQASPPAAGTPPVMTYNWDFSDGAPTVNDYGQIASDGTTRRNKGAIWTTAGTYDVDLTVTFDNGCESTAPTLAVTVNETAPPVADKLTAEYCVPESSNPPKQIRVVEPAADEQVIWVLTGAPTGSTLTVGDEFGVGTVNSEFRVTGGMNGSRLTMRQDANNGTIYGTWTFDAKLVNTTTGCESTVTTGFTVTANEPPSDAFRSAGTFVSFPFSANLDYDADHNICPGEKATYGTEANTAGINNVAWSISGGGAILAGANARNVKVRWDNPGTHTLTFMVTNVATGCMSTNSLQVTVLEAPAITINKFMMNPFNEVCVGDEARFLASASAAGPPAVQTYTWAFSGSPSVMQYGQTAADGSTKRNQGATWTSGGAEMVDLTVTYDNGCSVTAPTHNVTVNALPAAPTEATKTIEFCEGAPSIDRLLRLNNPNPLTGDQVVVWVLQSAPAGVTLAEYNPPCSAPNSFNSPDGYFFLSGTNDNSIRLEPAAPVGDYVFKAKVLDCATGCTGPLSAATYTITKKEPITSLAIDVNPDSDVCLGATAAYEAVVTGGTGPFSYAWCAYNSGDGSGTCYTNGFTPGGDDANQTRGWTTSTGPKSVGVTVSQPGCPDVSELYSFTVVPDPTVGITVTDMSGAVDDDGIICNGDDATLTANTTGGTGTATFAWESSTDGGTTWAAAGTGNPLAVSPTENTEYRVTVNFDGPGCDPDISAPALIEVRPEPKMAFVFTNPTNFSGEICNGATVDVDLDVTTPFQGLAEGTDYQFELLGTNWSTTGSTNADFTGNNGYGPVTASGGYANGQVLSGINESLSHTEAGPVWIRYNFAVRELYCDKITNFRSFVVQVRPELKLDFDFTNPSNFFGEICNGATVDIGLDALPAQAALYTAGSDYQVEAVAVRHRVGTAGSFVSGYGSVTGGTLDNGDVVTGVNEALSHSETEPVFVKYSFVLRDLVCGTNDFRSVVVQVRPELKLDFDFINPSNFFGEVCNGATVDIGLDALPAQAALYTAGSDYQVEAVVVRHRVGTAGSFVSGYGSVTGGTLDNGDVVAGVNEALSHPETEPVFVQYSFVLRDLVCGTNDFRSVVVEVAPQPLLANCPTDITANTSDDGTGDCATDVAWTHPDVANACAPVTLTASIDGGTPVAVTPSTSITENFGKGTYTVEYESEDGFGNTDVCSFTITVEDDEAPIITCEDITVELDANGEYTMDNDEALLTLSDNCGPSNGPFTVGGPTARMFDCDDAGMAFPRTMVSTDPSGNTGSCDYNVTVEDNMAPVITCEDITVELDADGEYMMDNDEALLTISDNCGFNGPFTVGGPTARMFDCDDAGMAFPRTMVSTDPSGNTGSCDYNVTVEDNMAPVITCEDITVELDANGEYMMDNDEALLTISDNCGFNGPFTSGGPTARMFDCDDAGMTFPRTMVSTDPSGNTGSCDYNVTVEDNMAPVITCEDITVELDANGEYMMDNDEALLTISDNCGFNGPFTVGGPTARMFDCDDAGMAFPRTMVSTDPSGNTGSCDYNVTVEDNVAPDAICQDITVQLDASGSASIMAADVDGGSTDACGIASLSVAPNTFGCGDVGGNTVTLTVEDTNGNTSKCTSTVTVEDNVAPDAICQDITVQLDASGSASIMAADVDGGSTDACGIASLSVAPNTFGCGDVGGNTVTLTVEDTNGNTSKCTSTVTVEDNVAPDAICQDITVQLDASGSASIMAADVDGGSTDACGIASLSVAPNTFGCGDVGGNTVTLTVEDTNGNTSKCTSTVTVEDNVAPDAICQDITVQLDASGSASIMASDVDGGSTDACGIAGLSVTPNTFGCGDVGGNTVTLTVEDTNGNTSTCTSTVTVEDNIAPTAVCLSTTVELQPDGTYTLQEADVFDAANSSDNCAITQVDFPATTYTCDDALQSFSVNVAVSDAAGNSDDCTADIYVEIGTALPAGWSTTDIGQVTLGNAYAYDPCIDPSGEFTITGSGNNAVSSTTDNVAFASQTLCGDGMITAKVESITPNGYGGLMIRETTAAGSKQVAIFSNLTNVLRHETRYTTGGNKVVQSHYRPFPIWLRLQRQGDWVFAYYSTTGATYGYVHAVYVPMQNCVEIGLASFTYLPNAQTEAVFSNVSISGGTAPLLDNGSGLPAAEPQSQELMEAELFPNPTVGAFTLALPKALDGEATATLRNQVGQVVEQRRLKPGDVNTEWDVSGLPSGLYFMEVRQQGMKPQTLRVVKQ